jgi:ribonuclease HI
MELWAIIMGLKALTEPCLVTIYTDSKNAIGWLTGTWRINDDQIKMFKRLYDQVAGPHSIMFHHVPGDDSVELNTKVDRVAKERARTAADLAQLAWVYHDDDGPVETEWPPRIGG